ncbi:MAG: peptidylprolyl isomerase [Bacteroidota bacterium]
MMRIDKITLLAVLLLLSSGLIAQQKAVIDKIVGKVGNELVLLSDVEEQFDLMSKEQGGLPEDFRCTLMDNLLAKGLLLTQARLDSVEVSDEEVDAQLNARIDNILGYMNGNVAQFEEYYGQSISEVRKQFRGDLEDQLLVQRMRGQIVADISVTPAEVKDFFASIPVDSLPYFNSEVEIGEIVLKPKVNETEKAKARAEVEELRTRIVDGGEDFGELARKYSDDGGSARVDGNLGNQRRGTFVPEFEAAAYNLENGQISKAVETEFGFHIIQTLERRGNSINTRHILIKPDVTENDLIKTRSLLDSIRTLVLEDSTTFSRAVKRYSDENQQSYNNDGNMVNPKSGNTFFEIADLEPDIYFTIDTMEVGDISAPIEFRNPLGEIYYRIIFLKSRTRPHKANLSEDYSKIKAAALEAKTTSHVNKWVQEKMGATYISIDPRYHSCPNLQPWIKVIRP